MNTKFAEKRQKLKEVSVKLKQYFVGLDYIIDDLIEKVTAWYLFPQICTRPLIINLWGMTGVGKTDLIRQFVREIGFNDSFLEVQMASKNVASFEKTIHKKLLNSSILPNQPAVVLLDEFQRFRSVDQEGKEIHDADFQDVWQLLSDGKFSLDGSIKDSLTEMMCSRLFSKQWKEEDAAEKDDDEDAPVASEKKNPFVRTYKTSQWDARQLKGLLLLEEPIEAIMRWSDEEFFQVIQNALTNLDKIKQPDYSQCLIFVGGNIDEVYRSATNVSDVDIDADIVHERTKKLSLIDIKEGLRQRFKPEQISRLGNIHIVYPSLSRSSYEEIIVRKLRYLEKTTASVCDGIQISFDQTINKFLYDNGVFPTQGTRPLFSTIDDAYNCTVPNIIIPAIEKGVTSIKLSYANDGVVGEMNNGESVFVPYVGCLDKVRKIKSQDIDRTAAIAVHEAGHAIVHAVLTKTSPNAMVISSTSDDMGGFVFPVQMFSSKESIINRIVTYMAGTCAEQLVFGDDYRSTSASQDIYDATALLANMYRVNGLGGELMRVTGSNMGSSNEMYASFDDTNKQIKNDVAKFTKQCVDILTEHKMALLMVAKELRDTKNLSKERFVEICTQNNIKCRVSNLSDLLIHGYNNALEQEMMNEIQKVTRLDYHKKYGFLEGK